MARFDSNIEVELNDENNTECTICLAEDDRDAVVLWFPNVKITMCVDCAEELHGKIGKVLKK